MDVHSSADYFDWNERDAFFLDKTTQDVRVLKLSNLSNDGM